jgi:hypothetical protein
VGLVWGADVSRREGAWHDAAVGCFLTAQPMMLNMTKSFGGLAPLVSLVECIIMPNILATIF